MTNIEQEVEIVFCVVCNTSGDIDNFLITINDEIVCNDCKIICERCDDTLTTDDSFFEIDGRDIWCESCTERRASYCNRCEAYTQGDTSYVTDVDENWCEGCADDAYWCDDCDERTAEGCPINHDEDMDDTRVIHDYSYRPDAIFHSTQTSEKLYFGIEVEVECGTREKVQTASTHAYQLEVLDLAYLKSDGSLNCGFEIVTHPMSHDYYKNNADDFWKVIEELRSDHQVKSWNTRTCGVHIHISRAGFSGGSHMHRFLNLVYSNQALYEAIAGRSSERWAKFTDIIQQEWHGSDEPATYKRTFAGKLNYGRHSDRYSAVNTQNQATLEMRIFRGSVKGDTVKAYLDLAHASVEYTRVMSVAEVRGEGLKSHSFIAYILERADLYPELVARLSREWTEERRLADDQAEEVLASTQIPTDPWSN